MKISIIPDSFKGSLTSNEVCECIKNSISSISNNDVFCYPMSDGGEGFAKCYNLLCNGTLLYTKCHDIYNNIIDAYIVAKESTAIIECALVSGIQSKKDIMNASSIGTGELIKFAIDKGFKDIIIGLGGTGCCDGAIGAISALGGVFFDENRKEIRYPTPKIIKQIDYCDLTGFYSTVKNINFTYACDVENCFYGKNGAAYVFAKQKGATDKMLPLLDNNLIHIEKLFGKDINSIKGAGAAGGLCGGLFAITGGKIQSGFDILCDKENIKNIINNSDLVVTGEGKTDSQTLMGKLPKKICDICNECGTKVVLISGSIEGVQLGDKMISLTDENTTPQYAIDNAKEVLFEKAKKIID